LHGWIELHNTSATPVDISDMSLSNSAAQPRRYVFAPGTIVPGQRLSRAAMQWRRRRKRDEYRLCPRWKRELITFNHTLANGGALHDSVVYGRQIADFAIGRVADGPGRGLCVCRAAGRTERRRGARSHHRIAPQ
jgi:hypothetical protein